MPLKPLSATLLLCEKALTEADGVVSAIRFGDLFHVPVLPNVSAENQIVLMTILVMCKFGPSDESKHSIKLRLKRPDGTETDVDFGKPLEVLLADLKPKTPEAPRGFNVIAPWGVKPTHMGLHRLNLFVDGEEVAYALFMLARPPAEAGS